jgi:hypothetical protein
VLETRPVGMSPCFQAKLFHNGHLSSLCRTRLSGWTFIRALVVGIAALVVAALVLRLPGE